MWTPSSPYFMSLLTTFANPDRRKSARVLKPPSARVRSSPSLSSPAGADSPAKGTSTATLMVICEEHSPLTALKRHRKRQLEEKLGAGGSYEYSGSSSPPPRGRRSMRRTS